MRGEISCLQEVFEDNGYPAAVVKKVLQRRMLGMWVWNASGGVCKKWYLNLLESSFIFNLALLSAATLYAKLAGGNQGCCILHVRKYCLFHLHWDNHLPCVPTIERFKSLEKPSR